MVSIFIINTDKSFRPFMNNSCNITVSNYYGYKITCLMKHEIVMSSCCISKGFWRLYQILYKLFQVLVAVCGFRTQWPDRIWLSVLDVSAVTTILCSMFGFHYVTAWVCTHINN